MPADTPGRRYSRRRFLGAASAGALAAGTTGRIVVEDAHAALALSQSNRFGRMFAGLPPFAQVSDSLVDALNAFGDKDGPIDARDDMRTTPDAPGPLGLILNPGRNEDSTTQAGLTFLGQFVDHDMTFDEVSPLGVPVNPDESPNSRQPTLNLDSLYGGGFGDTALVLPDGHMRIEQCDPSNPSSREDVPRLSDGTAVIADRRNDENAMISGFQSAFLRFHNRAFDVATNATDAPAVRYADARRLTTWHYQWIVLHEFLPAIVGQKRVDQIRKSGRKYYRPSGEPFVPVEFQIAYRLHTLARPSYRLNFTGAAGSPLFLFLFHPDVEDLRGGQRAPHRFVDWQTFFQFPGVAGTRTTKKIDRLVSTPMFTLPFSAIATGDPPTVLAQRNLLRHITWGLPSGQAIAKAMGERPLSPNDLRELREFGHGLDRSTPLWHYVNAEGELLEAGQRMGPVGGRIVAEVIMGLLELDPLSFLQQPGWKPTLPAKFSGSGNFKMIDFLDFAGVAPTSGGS